MKIEEELLIMMLEIRREIDNDINVQLMAISGELSSTISSQEINDKLTTINGEQLYFNDNYRSIPFTCS